MKRLFYEMRVYDYQTEKEMEKHIEEMENKGWMLKEKAELPQDSYYKFTVYYQKQF